MPPGRGFIFTNMSPSGCRMAEPEPLANGGTGYDFSFLPNGRVEDGTVLPLVSMRPA